MKSDIKVRKEHKAHVYEVMFQSVCGQLGIIQHIKVSIKLRNETSDGVCFISRFMFNISVLTLTFCPKQT